MSNSYQSIFKSTFLFGFVQVFNIIAKIVLNKVVAILLGTEGMGIIGLFQSTINMLKTASGLGISQSAVRDVSEANVANNEEKFSRIITITIKLIWITAILGAIVTFILSSQLSQWTFGNSHFTLPFMWISLVVFLNVLNEGQLAILMGMRQLRALAKASLAGSILGLLVGLPVYYFLGLQGIIPSLILTALSSLFFSFVYVRRIKYRSSSVSVLDSLKEGRGMVKMGIALMYVTFLGFVSDFIIRSYISNSSSLEMVGIYQAGATIISGYFGIVLTAMSTDYYPRISAVNKDNDKLMEEVNRQSEVGLILLGPLVVMFMFLMPIFIRIMYTEKFLLSINYISYAVFGTLIVVCSNAMGMILLAKQKSNVFIYSVSFSRLLSIAINIISFKYFGLIGLGLSTIIMAIIHILIMQAIMYKLYSILFKLRTIAILTITLFLCLIAFFVKDFQNQILKYSLGVVLLSSSLTYTIIQMRKIMDIDVLRIIRVGVIKRGK